MKKLFIFVLCLVLIGCIADSAMGMSYDPYSAGSGYGYGYGSMSGYPSYGTGSLDGYTMTPPSTGYYPSTSSSSGYYPSTVPSTGSLIPRYTITYMPGAGVSGSPFSTEWYPGDAIISGQGFSRQGYTQTGWSFYDGGPKAFYLGQHTTISNNMVLYPFWERVSAALNLTVIYSGNGTVRLSGGTVPNGWTGKLEPGQSFNFILLPYDGHYVYSIFLAGWYRNAQYGNQFMVTYDMLQGQNQTMTIRFESIYLPPKTGDDGNVALWVTLGLLAGIAACVLVYRLMRGKDKKERTSSFQSFLTLILIILLVFMLIITIINPSKDKSVQYFQEAFPLVVKGDDYLQDMVFVEPQQSDLFEAYGYSASESLLVTLTKGDHKIHYYPETGPDMFELLSSSPTNMDDFLIAWANGEWSPYN